MLMTVAMTREGGTITVTKAKRVPNRGVQRAKSAATRGALIAVARANFTQSGYHQTGTNDLVALASVTRGALYHHFTDKKDLFEAVFRQVAEETAQRANQAAFAHSGNLWEKFLAAMESYLKLRADDPEAQRILTIEGPAVFGWERWRELQSDTLDVIADTLVQLMDQKLIRRLPPRALASQISAALNDAALAVANSQNPESELRDQTAAMLGTLRGLQMDQSISAN